MLTYGFMIHKIINKQNNHSMKKETFLNQEAFEKFHWSDILFVILLLLISIFGVIISGMVAYKCNKHSNGFFRFFAVLLAIIFSDIYVYYYLIRYVLMGQSCYPIGINYKSNKSNKSTTKNRINNK